MLEPGARVGKYEIVDIIGKGGMGEVYRARDPKLGRDVAVKILPKELSEDAERIARFEREARLLGSLNHPHIATLYGLEEDGIVMELVEGEDLAERLRRGALPLEEALEVAKQVAEALDAAHGSGVIHRDLKPANLKRSDNGAVKILDFGLAKALAADADAGEGEDSGSSSPTQARGTADGLVLGTASYMSPEQARGKSIDRRTDIWAFGAVLYELLSGVKAFGGETPSDVIAAVLKNEPDWTALPADTPAGLRELLERCLAKDARQRWRDIGDVRYELDRVTEVRASAAPAENRRPVMPLVLAAAAGALVVGGLVGVTLTRGARPERESAPVKRFVAATGELDEGFGVNLALSPDGAMLVYATREDDANQLYLREMDSVQSILLPGTQDGVNPSFSPDGRQIAFFAEGAIRKSPVSGGPPAILTEVSYFRGMTWESDDSIIYGTDKGLMRIPASGGAPSPLTATDDSVLGHFWPSMLPDRHGVLFTIAGLAGLEGSRLAVADRETGQFRIVLDEEGYNPIYSPTGHLLFVRGYSAMAIRFDLQNLETNGSADLVLESVDRKPGGVGQLSLASDGTLAYVPRSNYERPRKLVWVDRQGELTAAIENDGIYLDPRISPNGRNVAVVVDVPGGGAARFTDAYYGILKSSGVAIYDTARGVRTAFRSGRDAVAPVWSPDGSQIAFARLLSLQGGHWGLFTSASTVDETAEGPLLEAPYVEPNAWTTDGAELIVSLKVDVDLTGDVARVAIASGARSAFLDSAASEYDLSLSPDGRLAAFVSQEAGQEEVYIATFPEPERRWQVSSGGGFLPRWSPDGKEVLYARHNQLIAVVVAVDRTGELRLGRPQILVDDPSLFLEGGWDIHPDGQRFLVLQLLEEDLTADELHVVLHWTGELERLVPAER